MKPLSTARTRARIARTAEIVALAKTGISKEEIARRLGVSRTTVNVHLEDHAAEIVQVPAWVPAYLHEDYRIIAAEDGEEDAASYARQRKRAQLATGSFECGGR